MRTIAIGPNYRVTPEDVHAVAEGKRIDVCLTPRALRSIKRSRAVVERLLKRKAVVYGLTTGFGKFKDVLIPPERVAELQRNLLLSHSVGVGAELSREVVRAALFVRINSLAQGYSGVRPVLLETALALLNADIVPVVPCQGSVGSSGDLAPLSHMGLALIGEGQVRYRGRLMSAAAALKRARLKPLELAAKEGLAWNNGTSVMLGLLALALVRAERLAGLADISCALSLEALQGVSAALRPEIHRVRPHAGQRVSAANIRALIAGSRLVDSAPERVQDAYSLRCAPQVHGASRETIAFVRGIVETELGSVTDNPIIFPETGEALSGGNFHGEPLAQAADALSIALAELANIAERRIARLVDGTQSEGLPLFLVPPERAGYHSGLMMPQYTAAALVSENKSLAHPASVDSIPTSAGQEDHVSMGTIAARQAAAIADNAEQVIAIEFLTALQAVDFRGPKKLGTGTARAYRALRKNTPFVGKDRLLYRDIARVRENILAEGFAEHCFSAR